MTRLVRLKLAPRLSCAIPTQRAAAAGRTEPDPGLWRLGPRVSREKHPEWLAGCASQCVVNVEM